VVIGLTAIYGDWSVLCFHQKVDPNTRVKLAETEIRRIRGVIDEE
jgi:hypothetical protein